MRLLLTWAEGPLDIYSLTMLSTLSFVAYLVIGAVGYSLVGRAIHRWAVARFTALNELEELGIDRKPEQKLKGTAVVCGGRYEWPRHANLPTRND